MLSTRYLQRSELGQGTARSSYLNLSFTSNFELILGNREREFPALVVSHLIGEDGAGYKIHLSPISEACDFQGYWLQNHDNLLFVFDASNLILEVR